MGSMTRFLEAYDLRQPPFGRLRVRLAALLHWFGCGAQARADASWPDDLNDHYLRDVDMERGARHQISGSVLHQLRIGPR